MSINFENGLKKEFESALKLRNWFGENHHKEKEVFLRFYNKSSGKTAVSYSEALDEALCVGWIDSVVKKVDEDSRYQRFTPRRDGSYWSYANINRAELLIKQQRMLPSGLEVFEKRKIKDKNEVYKLENPTLSPKILKQIKTEASKEAYAFYKEQSESYHKRVAKFIENVKRDDTKEKRLKQLLESLESQINLFK